MIASVHLWELQMQGALSLVLASPAPVNSLLCQNIWPASTETLSFSVTPTALEQMALSICL